MKKLVMTLLVRDEEDIVEENICFHLLNGVDYIVAIDNGSKDDTPNILEKYSKKGFVSFSVIKEHNFQQAKWVSQMAKVGVEEFGATHLLHCDGDEFWLQKNNNLKEILPESNEIFMVSRKNWLPPNTGLNQSPIFDQFQYFVKDHPIKTFRTLDEYKRFARSVDMLLYDLAPKILTPAIYTDVGIGSHSVIADSQPNKVFKGDILIHHFPIRSYEQFRKKVIQNALALKQSPENTSWSGRHWKTWFEDYEQGRLEEVFKKICLPDNLDKYLKDGFILKTRVPKSIRSAKLIFNS